MRTRCGSPLGFRTRGFHRRSAKAFLAAEARRREGGSRAIGRPLALDLNTMASYLVTGGAGFIGSHLAEELVRRGHSVRVADSLITGKRRNLDHVKGVEFLEGDLA